ncbi:DUF448 domain-containing protein [Sphingomonas astaxanthinifaciens]|uniref:YlxR domain-containing protein n=1 Tax=Sphingomonas astaxanthinifaciens DSM 22298 TaxID=1123267 RepID=A0ABQ5Z9Q1_9SPHN|nr:DUF448 domain-containing protein [Sphingomonas astaxanthinifaciens]GLR47598.1 hypothetical protein GCM10007925_13110 [Sphingomonas astaxanthinifaciens DSM 22298]
MRNPRNDGDLDCSPAQAGAQCSADEGTGLLLAQETGPQRSCILTRRTAPRDELIRLVLGPDGQVHPDVRAKAPGRGAWIGVGRAELETAMAKGKLKGALARAFKGQAAEVPADLPEKIEQALSRAALDRLGMEARSGTLINGADRVEQAARMGKVHLLLHAADAGADGRRKLDQAWRVGGSEELGHRHGLEIPASRTILSMALGRENVVHAALTDPGAASRVTHALNRWRAFIVGPGLLGRGDDAAGQRTADDE